MITIGTGFFIASIIMLFASIYYTIPTITESKAIIKHLKQMESMMEDKTDSTNKEMTE